MYMEFPGTTSPCCVVPRKSQALPCDGCSPLINSRDSATSASSGIKPGRLWRFIVARSIARELKRLVNWRRKRDRQVIRDGDARGAGPNCPVRSIHSFLRTSGRHVTTKFTRVEEAGFVAQLMRLN